MSICLFWLVFSDTFTTFLRVLCKMLIVDSYAIWLCSTILPLILTAAAVAAANAMAVLWPWITQTSWEFHILTTASFCIWCMCLMIFLASHTQFQIFHTFDVSQIKPISNPSVCKSGEMSTCIKYSINFCINSWHFHSADQWCTSSNSSKINISNAEKQ